MVPWADALRRAIAAFVTVNPYRRQAAWARGFFGEELERLADDPRVPVLSDETLCGDPFQRRYNGRDVADRIPPNLSPDQGPDRYPRAEGDGDLVLPGVHHAGGTLSLEDFVGTGHEPLSFTPILREDFLAYDFVVGYYQELYGRENVLVLPIEQLQRDQAGYVQTILDFCGCPGRLPIEAEPTHTGWSAIDWWRDGCSTR